MLYRNFATTEEIDAEYNMNTLVGDLTPYFDFYIQQSASARSDLECVLDVHFGPTIEETVDIFPAADPNAPILIFIHGGYWRRLSSKEFSYVARGLVSRGITVLVANYALCPKVSLPEITRQMRALAAWTYTSPVKFNGNRERIYAAGHSAGGHLATRVITTNWVDDYALPKDLVKGAYAFSGLYDLNPIRYTFVQPGLQLNGDIIRNESPLFNIPAQAPRLITEVGGDESSEFKRQSKDFVAAWKAAGHMGAYIEVAGMNHFTVIDELNDPDSPLCERLVAMIQD